MKNIFLSIFAVAALASCSTFSSSKSTSGSQAPLIGTSWELSEEVNAETPTIVFDENRVSGNAGCNNYFSNDYSVNPIAGEFSANNVATTRKSCMNMSVETNFLSMLKQANKYVVRGTTLELYKDSILLLKFNKK